MWEVRHDARARELGGHDDRAAFEKSVMKNLAVAEAFEPVERQGKRRGLRGRMCLVEKNDVVNRHDKRRATEEGNVPVREMDEVEALTSDDAGHLDLLGERVPTHVRQLFLEIGFLLREGPPALAVQKHNIAVLLVNLLQMVEELFDIATQTTSPRVRTVKSCVNPDLHKCYCNKKLAFAEEKQGINRYTSEVLDLHGDHRRNFEPALALKELRTGRP